MVSHWKPSQVEHDQIDKFASIDDWNYHLFYNLWKHVDTDFALLIHEDGFVVNPDKWQAAFLDHDYIGSPWTTEVAKAIQGGREQELVRVGNSVSIRSKRLMELPTKIGIPWRPYNNDYNEDTQICAHNRKYFISCGMSFAPVELAVYFGREHEVPEGKGIEPFVFHKYGGKNKVYRDILII